MQATMRKTRPNLERTMPQWVRKGEIRPDQ